MTRMTVSGVRRAIHPTLLVVGLPDAGYRWTMASDLDLGETERTLRARQAEMHEKIAALAKAPERGSGISFGKRVGDGTVEAVSRLNEIGVGNNLVAALERVERALEKIDAGTYGVCDNCGGTILPARLRVAPESTTCVACARR